VSYGVLACPKCGEAADHGVSMPRFSTRPEHAVDRITCRHCGLMVIPEELVLKRHDSVLRGTIPAAGGTHTAIGRIARGTNSGTATDSSGAYTAATGITVGTTGSTLVVSMSAAENISQTLGMKWNGVAMSSAATVTDPVSFNSLHVYLLQNATAGTGSLVVDDGGASTGRWEVVATEITAPAAVSFDKQAADFGTSTAPSSGNTAATTQANEMLLGFIWRANATITGITSGTMTAGTQGQTVTQLGRSVEEYYLSVLSTGAYNAAKSGCTLSDWLAAIVTLKEN
jgi:hypothetical protein